LTVTKNDLKHGFKFEVTEMPGGEVASRCFDCGTCTGVCPVSRAESAFDPRRIIHMIKMGLKEQLLGSEAIWFCSHCDTCAFVCPQEVVFSNVVDVLREMAIKEGYVDPEAFEPWAAGPCKASCPAHISIPGFIAAISQGKYAEGLKLIKREMPFPAICGRVCPHPCETECNRGNIDKPIAIEALKRFLADEDLYSDISYIPEKKGEKKEKVAIIGAGPAGLTAACYLAIEGYPVTVFEKLPVAGGMMAVGIPEFRLPRDILQAEIEKIRELGVEIKLNVEIGKDIGFQDIQRDYQSIFIGIGCHRPIKLGVPGEDELKGVIDGITFLRDIHLGKPTLLKGRAVVIGGGNVAVDSARVAKRLGFRDVAILYRRTREEMPAYAYEVDEAMEEGIEIEFLTAPTKIIGENGEVGALQCVRMELGEPDESGRRRPIPIKGSEFEVKTDVVIAAIGQQPDLGPLSLEGEIKASKRGWIVVDPQTGLTNMPGIFAGGDVVSGPRTVVEAVGFGKNVASAIDLYLREEDMSAARKGDWQGMEFRPEDAPLKERVAMPRISLSERQRSFKEIDLGFNEEQAKSEAERCLMLCGMQKGKK
jgi:NADPH-dependent glutamate synthase beta subunit-like oxidoreductase